MTEEVVERITGNVEESVTKEERRTNRHRRGDVDGA